jgi:hypothetical protein
LKINKGTNPDTFYLKKPFTMYMVFFFGMCAHMTMINKPRMNPLEMCVLASPFLLGFIHSSLAMHVKERLQRM